jgi:hypothetical protein
LKRIHSGYQRWGDDYRYNVPRETTRNGA